jgi:ribonuclease HII
MPDLTFEQAADLRGFAPVAGLDEAGRGPWAGPVVAAAVVLDRRRLPVTLAEGLDDSKKLKRAHREALFETIRTSAAVGYGVGWSSVAEIDTLNILEASLLAMRRAFAALPVAAAYALVDGNRLPELPCPCEAIVKGDALCLSIAGASVVAKVTRDREMARLALAHPGYGWETNQGYGTKVHRAALTRLGPTVQHRRSFRPVAEALRFAAARQKLS